MDREAEFKILKNENGEYYWHLQAANNRIVAWSGQTYTSKQWCLQGLEWIRANAYSIPVYD